MAGNTSFDNFADSYDKANGNTGDYTHINTVDPALFECIGDIQGLKIYEIACGNGYNARRMVKEGANEVWASDISTRLIEIASTKYQNSNSQVKYSVRDALDINNLPEDYFDLVIISMAIHYVENLDKLFKNINKLLQRGGRIVFVTNHPLANLGRIDIGAPGYDLEKALQRARKYLESYCEPTVNYWSGQKDLIIYRAPISLMVHTLVRNGFLVDKMIEPRTVTNYANNNLEEPKNATTPIPLFYALGATKVINLSNLGGLISN